MGSEGFERVLKATPRLPKDAFKTGWEKCTRGGSPSIIASVTMTGHTHFVGNESTKHKGVRHDHMLCNATTSLAVYARFRDDYDLMVRAGLPYTSPHTCA